MAFLSLHFMIKLFKLMHNAYNDRLPESLSDNIVTMRNTEYSLRRSENIAIPTGFDLAIWNSLLVTGALSSGMQLHPDIRI